jgi:hypothetical protein
MTDENGTAGPDDGDSPSDDADSSGPTEFDADTSRDDESRDSEDEEPAATDESSDSGSDASSSAETGAGARASDRRRDAEKREPEERDGAPDLSELAEQLSEIREEVDDIDGRTVEKPALEAELKRYVRARMRRGRARGWGPYLVLLYGTIMTVAAFRYLDGWFAIGAMIILFLSTLGLYTLFVLVGVGLNLLSIPRRTVDAIRRRR